jgi:hypothetical protein
MSSGGGEMRGFVFAVVFIVLFGTLLASVPAGLQGPNADPDTIIPIDPNVLTGFAETEEWYRSDYSYYGYGIYYYDYDAFGGLDWRTTTDNETFLTLGSKETLWIFWFGGIDACEFEAPSGLDRGTQLDFDEIDADDEEGLATYSMSFTESGNTAGSLIVYWNNTAYPSISDAWTANNVTLLHGVGFADTATTNIGALIISLLFLQLPDVPVLINVFLAVPVWACIVFVLWFIVKEMIPFL